MRRLVIHIVTLFALGLPATGLFAKSPSHSSGSHASGTGSNKWHAIAKGQAKNHVVKGNYNPNTGKRAMRVSKE